ncbi:hypothetical protein GGF50DRAFT_55363, partial [Schizophyllum commune]
MQQEGTINLNSPSSVPLPPDEPEEDDAVENALQIVRDLDASFHRRREGELWNWDSLEKKVKGYANFKELRPEDVEDHGIAIAGTRARFRVRQALLDDVLDTAEEFENLLLGLRAMDPDKGTDKSWHLDEKGAFIKALEGARTLASLNLAWRGLAGRFNHGYHVYAKYLARAYYAYGAYEGAPPTSPGSTAASVYQEMDRYPLVEEKVRYAIGALPGAQVAAPPSSDRKGQPGGRDRLVGLADRDILATPTRLRELFPEREPEEDPAVVSHEGYRHYDWNRDSGNLSAELEDRAETKKREEEAKRKRDEGEEARELRWDDDEANFPETPAPRGRGRRGGRRTSAFSFFGQVTPRSTPFGPAVLPPPLQQEARRRGRGPPQGGPGGGGGGGRPPRHPASNGPNNPSSGGRGRGHPHRGRGGGGGPPGDPPGGSQGGAVAGGPRAPYGNTTPTIHPVLKSSNVPSWDGNRSTAIDYFWKINQLARSGGHLPEALGFWLWQKLVEGSSIELWYMTVSDDTKDWMQANATQWIQGVVDGFLGRRWVNQIASEFKQQGFREGHKHRFESPQDYISRRLMHARFLGYSTKGSYEEVQLVIERIPSHWHHMLSTSTIRSADELKERAIEFEAELMADSRRDQGDLESSVSAVLRKMGIAPGHRSSQARSAFKKVAFSAEPSSNENEDLPALTAISEAEDETESPSEDEEEPWEEILATAYSVVQRRPPAADKKYPFERRNDVRTTAKKAPPAPCFACGSPYHWNRECPHRDKYLASRRKEGNRVEAGEAAREKAYNAAWAIISDPGFEGAVPEEASKPEERKT